MPLGTDGPELQCLLGFMRHPTLLNTSVHYALAQNRKTKKEKDKAFSLSIPLKHRTNHLGHGVNHFES